MAWKGYDMWVGTPHESELACMSWDQLREVADAGWEIGAHTCSHPFLTELGDEELSRELREARRRARSTWPARARRSPTRTATGTRGWQRPPGRPATPAR